MTIYGLTGGIGMGKSTVAGMLASQGISVVDTDDLAREIVQPGHPALAEILQTFGPHLVDDKGQLRRGQLAEIVFQNPEARTKLEAITHPRIADRWRQEIHCWRNAGHKLGVVVIPLLFETQVEAEFDAIVCVACTAATQLERLRERGWSNDQIQQRCLAQLPVSEKVAWANYVVWTEGDLAMTAAQLRKIIPN